MSAPPEPDGLVRDFLLESSENLEQVDRDFVALERSPGDREILARIFRAVHTIKGSCGFLGFARLKALTHAGESLLGLLREGTRSLDAGMTTTLLRMVDAVRATLASIAATGREDDADHATIIAALDLHRAAAPTTPAAPRTQPATSDAVASFVAAGRDLLVRLDAGFVALDRDPRDALAWEALSSAFAGARGGCQVAHLDALDALLAQTHELLEALRERSRATDPQTLGVLLDVAACVGEALGSLEADRAPPREYGTLLARLDAAVQQTTHGPTGALAPAPAPADGPPPPAVTQVERAVQHASVVDQSVRVDVRHLDQLMNQVGELVLVRNQIARHVNGLRDEALGRMAQRLSLLTTELQETVMLTRLQPIETAWSRLPRMVRDLSLELGKRVKLVMQGGETELDRTLNEAIRAPLTHLVRNALDHGIEREADRLRLGKPAEGALALRAWHEGGQVKIEVSDDGRGIDPARIAQHAVERGMLSTEAAAALTDRQKVALVFEPGFSTAEQITSVSGRGVGMDVVRSSIERINGLIEIDSTPGRGTRIQLKIPLTLAIVPALVVRTAGERFAIPQLSLLAVLRLGGSGAATQVEQVHHAPVYRWRDGLLPLVWLGRELGLQTDARVEDVSIVVLQVDDRRFGLVVDEVLDTEEIVVKPLGTLIGRIPVFAGATLMGDGRAALILDVLGMAQASGVAAGRAEAAVPAAGRVAPEPEAERRTVLLVRVGREQAAIPLTDSMRLERFPRSTLETSGGRPIIQYRGAVLPLVGLGGNVSLAGSGGWLSVVVQTRGEGAVGFVVDELLDIVHERFAIQPGASDALGVTGTTVIERCVANVLDLSRIQVPGGGVR